MIRPRVSGIFPPLPFQQFPFAPRLRLALVSLMKPKQRKQRDSWSLRLTPTAEAEPGEQWLQTNEALQLNAADRTYPSSRAWNVKASPGA